VPLNRPGQLTKSIEGTTRRENARRRRPPAKGRGKLIATLIRRRKMVMHRARDTIAIPVILGVTQVVATILMKGKRMAVDIAMDARKRLQVDHDGRE
jgi:hypothetical protein